MTSTPGRPNPSSSTAAALGPALARGDNSKPGNRAVKYGQKWKGGLTTGACWAPRRLTGIEDLLHCTLDPLLGACLGLEGEHVRWGSTPGWQWAVKSERGPATGACWAPRAVHRDRQPHHTCYLNWGPMWMPSRPPVCQNHTDFGVAVLNCMQEIKNKPLRTAPSGLKWAAYHVLAALSALQQRPYVLFSDNVKV